MKKFYKISANAESNPVRLVATVGLAVVVMLFINGFIGSMGGFPAFIAFTLVFFPLRTVVEAGNRITHQLSMSSKKETAYLMGSYCFAYLVLWGILRIAFLVSRVTGWGNLNGNSALDYVKELLSVSMLEKWAYLFAGILMFAFVVSLFPLVVIREHGKWLLYALLDGAGFALICIGINAGDVTCVIDHLLLYGERNTGQEALFLAGIIVFTVVVAVLVFHFAAWEYGPKPGRMDEEAIRKAEHLPGEKMKPKQKARTAFFAAAGVAAILIVFVIVAFMPADTMGGYSKVAEFLTKDTLLGPMEYGGKIYAPVNREAELSDTDMPRGYLAGKNEDCSSRFYRKAVANLLYVDREGKEDYIQMKGADEGVYRPIEEIDGEQEWKEDTVFLIWDEDWNSESAYSHEPTGYTACSADLIEGLTMQFPTVNYRLADFDDYDAYFTIRSYSDTDEKIEKDTVHGNWVGCILVKDNRFYYGSYENQITGICLKQLLEVLGGNTK